MTIRRGNSIIAGNAVDIPSQTGQSGKFLTTNGTMASWGDTVDYTNITNCITEIPQDIKLELADGVLTLKAGSKFYVPNGAGVFDTVTIANDITGTYTASSSQRMFFYNVTNGYIQSCQVADVYSGATSPTRSGTIYWYDTTNNLVKRSSNGGSTWDTTVYSLSFCLCSVTNNNISSIDQVFNGFGYIGSTVFALSGVKGLIPNGRNEDGSLKNIEVTIDSVKTATKTWIDNYNQVWGYVKNPPTGVGETWYWNGYIESDEEPSNNEYTIWYKPSENITYVNNGAQSSTPNWEKVNYINFGKAGGINSQEIKIFTPKTTFHAVDSNDSSWLSGLGMPSNKYIDLTPGANGAKYTAPANGWFVCARVGSSSDQIVYMINYSNGYAAQGVKGTGTLAVTSVPVRKGDVIQIDYSTSGDVNTFRFIYAEGEN